MIHDDEIRRRTPVLRPREQSSIGSSEPSTSTTGPTKPTDQLSQFHAYTRRQLMGEEPLSASADLPVPVEDSKIGNAPATPKLIRDPWLPEPETVGVIIGFERSFAGTPYSYAAIKTVRGWYVTGAMYGPERPLPWTQLLAWMDQGQREPPAIWVATDWQELTKN